MGYDRDAGATLSFPAVQREPDEALSSWLARIARAHMLDLEHVEAEIGCRLAAVDHDLSAATVALIVRRTGTDLATVRAGVHPIASRSSSRHGELDWRVCRRCLEEDEEASRPLHVRTAWTHPLAVICLEHVAPLLIPSAEHWRRLAGDEALPARQDTLLNETGMEPLHAFIRAAELVCPTTATGDDGAAGQLEREIADLSDALGVQMARSMGQGAVLTLFEQPRRRRHVRAFTVDLQLGLLAHLEPADRLLFVRAALALRWPSEGFAQEQAVYGDWFTRVMHMVVPSGRRRVIGNHALDPLGLVAMALPAKAFHQLRLRSSGWSMDLRQRWAAAEQLAALAGLT